jgi:hypothetical protein
MINAVRVQPVSPELYFHFEVRSKVGRESLATLQKELERVAEIAFAKKFPGLEIELEVVLKRGSIKGWIRADKKTTLKVIGYAAGAIIGYGELREGADYVWKDVNWALDNVRIAVRDYFDAEPNGGVTNIRTERRIGAIAQLDQVIERYQKRQISYEAYMAKATAILEKIAADPERNEIIAGLTQYIDARYGSEFGWNELVARLPPIAPPSESPPMREQHLPHNAILQEDKRDQKKLPRKQGAD